jgi:hypothetical protein
VPRLLIMTNESGSVRQAFSEFYQTAQLGSLIEKRGKRELCNSPHEKNAAEL